MASNELEMYTVYFSPTDYPGEYVVRRWIANGQPDPIPDKKLFMRSVSFHEIREKLEGEMHLYFMNRDQADDPAIVGTFI